ncbi:MAG: MFS transporter [Candidatus Obscuribacterales bacterium]|jgi:MFS family permease|nr:MFS transporter [Candidatus Obscuribacterales bacterium]
MAYTQILKQPHLVRLWLSQVLSSVGDQLYSIAAIWIAIKIGGANAGYVAAAGSITGTCLGLIGGVYADRWDRRKTMIAVDLLRAATVISLAVVGSFMPLALWQLGLSAMLIAGLGALFDPSLQAALPELTENEDRLQAMNALMQVNHRFARTLGPGAAGWLVSLMAVHHFFFLDGITYLVSAAAIFSISNRYNWKPNSTSQVSQGGLAGIWQDIRKGAQTVYQHEELFWSFGMYILANFAWSVGYTIGFPLWTKQFLHADVGTYGALVAAYGVGSVLSNIVMGTVKTRRRMLFISGSDLVFFVGFMILAFAPNLPVACFGSALAATGGPMADIVLMVMMQTDMPRDVLGKVFSLRYFVMFLGSALGLLVAPALYTAVNAQTGIVVSAVIFGLSGMAGLIRFGAKESAYKPYVDPTLEADLMNPQEKKAVPSEDGDTSASKQKTEACTHSD